jgi:hypothetical protein
MVVVRNTGSIATVAFPVFEAKHLVESEKNIQFLSTEKCVSDGFTFYPRNKSKKSL